MLLNKSLTTKLLGILDKTLGEYQLPEKESKIPMLLLAPNIINDGRKLFISPQSMSYLCSDATSNLSSGNEKVKGIDFKSFFKDQGSENLRFLTALRMSATFPYITPNISLPSNPEMKMMDSGISDNFGVSDAVRFLFVFNDWISEHTSGVIFLSIRDTEKNTEVEITENESLVEKFFIPIRSLYKNFDNIQDIHNDNQLEYAGSWFKGTIHRVDIQYLPNLHRSTSAIEGGLVEKENQRASLSWRLTNNEKHNIINSIYLPSNQKALSDLKSLLLPSAEVDSKLISKK